MKVVAYYRVSTKQHQGLDGLGIAAQKEAVERYCQSLGYTIVAEYCEAESGKNIKNRPELAKAVSHARGLGKNGLLVIAKLCRLARNLKFVATLLESKVNFIAVDNPNANNLTIHILAAMAEFEGKQISERTKAGLAQAKKRGKLLGTNRINADGTRHIDTINWRKGLEKARQSAVEGVKTYWKREMRDCYGHLIERVKKLRDDGLSLAKIAKLLNEEGHQTHSGGNFHQVLVWRISRMPTPNFMEGLV